MTVKDSSLASWCSSSKRPAFPVTLMFHFPPGAGPDVRLVTVICPLQWFVLPRTVCVWLPLVIRIRCAGSAPSTRKKTSLCAGAMNFPVTPESRSFHLTLRAASVGLRSRIVSLPSGLMHRAVRRTRVSDGFGTQPVNVAGL